MNERLERGALPVPAVHQFVPALIPRDATGSHTLLLRDVLRSAGWRSEIFAEATHDDLANESLRVEEYEARARPGDVLIYQFSTSSMVADLLAGRTEPLVLDYHNITSPELYGEWDPPAAARSAEARRQLAVLARRAVLGMADSEFNERDLVAAGCRRTAVVPVLVDLERAVQDADTRTAARLARARAGGGANWLFVGRVVPPKAQHRLVEALWAYRRLYDPSARLHLVGAMPSRRYMSALRRYAADLGLATAVRLYGEVSDAVLAAVYSSADVYVSLSEHEGYGIPLVEAARAGVPVVALGAAAIPETLGDAGLLVGTSEPALVAAAVHRVLTDEALRHSLVVAGQRRVKHHSLAAASAMAVRALTAVAGPPPGAGRSGVTERQP
ncbi:MAG: glycosyltransferase family 4 protein [Actinomycetota bacterium]|nr:glycosyltransferase family 4 protein [Actinomycetota bacterium]